MTAEETRAEATAETNWERAAQRAKHEWFRAINRQPAKDTSASVKSIAYAVSDRARFITEEMARKHQLPAECIGAIATWPKVDELGEDAGQADPRTVRQYLAALGKAGDLVIISQRHLRRPSVYVLARAGRPVMVAEPHRPTGPEEERQGESPLSLGGEQTGARQGESPLSKGGSARGDSPYRPEAPGGIPPVEGRKRPGESPPNDRGNPPYPLKEDPGIDPGSSCNARARAREAPPLELVAPVEAPTANAVAARRSKSKPIAPAEARTRELMGVARLSAEAAYEAEGEAFPGGKLAWNAAQWRQLAMWAQDTARVGLEHGRRYAPEHVLKATIRESVARNKTKPVGFWLARIGDTWAEIRRQKRPDGTYRVPFERVQRVDRLEPARLEAAR